MTGTYTEKKAITNKRYNDKFEKPTIRMTAEEKQEISRRAQEAGKSFNRYMIDCALGKH